MRWAGEPDVLLKLEPSTKWILNAVKIGMPSPINNALQQPSLCCFLQGILQRPIAAEHTAAEQDNIAFLSTVLLAIFTKTVWPCALWCIACTARILLKTNAMSVVPCRQAEGAAGGEHDAGDGCAHAAGADQRHHARQPLTRPGRPALHWRHLPLPHGPALHRFRSEVTT